MELYFAYGSNMSARQIRERCPTAAYVDLGRLEGFRLTFNRKGSYRQGSVASVELGDPHHDVVLGVLWHISRSDLDKMDEIEDPDAYVRIAVPVANGQGDVGYAWTYVSYPDEQGLSPDADYLKVMIQAAVEVGLPKIYVKGLERWKDA
ncbi:MAG: gamma-glutamylcyclotransferase family protein [Acidobacteriota bacterium]|nr:gamma-glutamylcyclotransferase family protein [Acidobacteriota bacterium]